VASHYLRAHEAEPGAEDAADVRGRALVALTRAGERAGSLGATAEAGRRFEQAAELASSDLERSGLLERAGEMALRDLPDDQARSLLAAAIGVYEELGLSHPAREGLGPSGRDRLGRRKSGCGDRSDAGGLRRPFR
jgi:hypothetical protein